MQNDKVIIGDYCILETPHYFGKNVYIGNYVHVRPDVRVDDFSEIRDHVFLAQGCSIGKNTKIFQFSNICAGAIIGDDCFIAGGVILANDRAMVHPLKPGQEWENSPPIVQNNVRIGINATILPGVVIREGCKVGAGAVVTKDTCEGCTYVGNPAIALEEVV